MWYVKIYKWEKKKQLLYKLQRDFLRIGQHIEEKKRIAICTQVRESERE